MLIALLIMPVAFLYIAVKLGLTPLNAVCLALLTSTAFSSGCWTCTDGPEKQRKSIKLFKQEMLKSLTVDKEQMKNLQEKGVDYSQIIRVLNSKDFDEAVEKSIQIIPGTSMFLWHLVSLGLLYWLATKIGPKFGYKIEPFPAFKDWTFNWNLVWLYIFGFTTYFLIGRLKDIPGVKIIQILGANCFIMSNILYLIIGFSLLFFMYDKYKIGAFSRIGLSIIIALIFSQFMIWLGLIDVWAEFRLKKSTPEVTDDSDDDDFFDY